MCIHIKYLFGFAVQSTDFFFLSLIILRLIQDKTVTGLAVRRKRIPIMAQDHRLLGWFSHLFPFIIMPNVI